MKHLDLFSGYGGFTIPASKHGVETIGFGEIDKYASSVLKYKFSDIPNYGDVCNIKKEMFSEPIDIVTGGSPCQDLSIAGKGAGLDGARSGLFFHFIRIIKEIQPTYFVWENVKGAFSSNKGWDFATVQIEMEQAGYDVWWQLLNAKDFGVPQNRERIFAIGVRKGSGREILFEQRESEQNINKVVNTGHDGTGLYAIPNSKGNVHSLDANYWKGSNNPNKSRRSQIAVYDDYNSKIRRDNIVGSITGNIGNKAPRNGTKLMVREATKKGYAVAEEGDSINLSVPNSKTRRGRVGKGVAQTLDTASNQATIDNMRIRRLTPTECERLMGLEDNWTAKGIMDEKEVDISDTQRYKMCGNGVVVNCVDYIYSLIK